MCQYSALKGCPSNWHYTHLQKLSSTGAGMVMLESTAINKIGRITKSDLCLYNDTQEKSLKKLIVDLKNKNEIKYGIQISHAGRKGSSEIPWVKANTPLSKKKSWNTVSASSIKKDKKWPNPYCLDQKQIKKIILDFKNAAKRANKINFDCLEIHMAHGYLLHQFFSPISNNRKDKYGGNFENRSRFLIEVSREIRKIWPKNKILGARITGTDHLKNGININESILLAKKLKKVGLDYVSVSSGGIIPITKMKQSEAFRIKMSHKIKTNSKMTSSIIVFNQCSLTIYFLNYFSKSFL
jgi:2,4-dienoyl-CoA reductase-like NADH-dependent reductase (Old Yellow Enzyme family)